MSRGNVAELICAPEVDGVLVGGASLDADGWATIVRRSSRVTSAKPKSHRGLTHQAPASDITRLHFQSSDPSPRNAVHVSVVLLILDSIVLVAAILLQSGKGGGLAASFGGATSAADSLIGTRQAGNLLTKASWWCGGIFLLLAFVLQIASTPQPRCRLRCSISR